MKNPSIFNNIHTIILEKLTFLLKYHINHSADKILKAGIINEEQEPSCLGLGPPVVFLC